MAPEPQSRSVQVQTILHLVRVLDHQRHRRRRLQNRSAREVVRKCCHLERVPLIQKALMLLVFEMMIQMPVPGHQREQELVLRIIHPVELVPGCRSLVRCWTDQRLLLHQTGYYFVQT